MSQKSDILDTLGKYLFPGQAFTVNELAQALAADGINIPKPSMFAAIHALKVDGSLAKSDENGKYIYKGKSTLTVKKNVKKEKVASPQTTQERVDALLASVKTPTPVNEEGEATLVDLPQNRKLLVQDDAVWVGDVIYNVTAEQLYEVLETGEVLVFNKIADL